MRLRLTACLAAAVAVLLLVSLLQDPVVVERPKKKREKPPVFIPQQRATTTRTPPTRTRTPPPPPPEDLRSLYETLRQEDRSQPQPQPQPQAQAVRWTERPEGSSSSSPVFVGRRVLIFTMDSTAEYEANALKGGAAGEITVRKSLTEALVALGAVVDVAISDADFEKRKCSVEDCDYGAVVLDPWTWAAPGWRPKAPLRGREDRVFLLDFFGAEGPRNGGIAVPPKRILTAYPTFPSNSFLGFAYDESFSTMAKKKNQVVVWGKDPKHFEGKERVLEAIADVAEVHVTLTKENAPKSMRQKKINITYHGHLAKDDWHRLLAESKAVVGLGHPLLGPTALDAVAHGCVYVDPAYAKPVKGYWSQHPYLRDHLGEPYVCEAKIDDPRSYVRCVQKALLQEDLTPHVPADFTTDAHRARVEALFRPVLLAS
mmetsp:Transcript_37637/g.120726  ORF Transcript_37637/g.120726 Transcript_37637/m.120726 type:complete len:429 (-) Transcript_37637:1635-2921(-)